MSDLVFISGSEEAAPSWEACASALEAAGHRWHGVSLGDLPWAEGYERAMTALLAQVPARRRSVVIGHSAGGLLLPRVADCLGAVAEVYVAALVPEPGKALVEQLFEDQIDIFTQEWLEEVRHSPKPSGDFLHPLYHECFSGFSARDRVYFVCERDGCINPVWQKAAARRLPGAIVEELPFGHDPQIEAPSVLGHHLLRQISRRS